MFGLVQIVPLFVELNTPSVDVPANTSVPITAMAAISGFAGSPVSTASQLDPLLVERNTPSYVPAKIFAPMNAKEVLPMLDGRPVVEAIQFAPMFVFV